MDHNSRQSNRMLFYTLFLAYIGTGISAILPGPALTLLASHTGMPLDVAGWAFTSGALGFSSGVTLAGTFSKRVSPKYILIIGMAIMGSGGLVVPWTHSFAILLIAQFILGIGFGSIDVSINTIVTLAFKDTLGESLNNLHSAFSIGALLGPLLLSLALQTVNEPTWAFAVGTLIALATIILLLRQHIPTLSQPDASQQQTSLARPARRSIFTHLVLWLLAMQMFLYIGSEVGFGNWITTAVSQSALVTLAVAAPTVTMFWIGLTSGRLLGAQVLKHGLFSENQLLCLCFIGSGLSGIIVALFPGTLWLSFSMSLLVGLFLGPIFPGIMAITSRIFTHALGVSSSMMFLSAGTSGLFLPVLVGITIAHVGIGWGIAIPALCSLLMIVPFYFTIGRHTLPSENDPHTIKGKETVSVITES